MPDSPPASAIAPPLADRLGLLAGVGNALAWGMTGVFVRLLPGLSPTAIVAGRLLIALAGALPLLLWPRLRRPMVRALRTPAAWPLALLTLVYYITAVAGYQLAPVAEVALLISTTPLFALAIQLAWRQPVRRREVTGALIALVGIGLILAPNVGGTAGSGRLAGHALGLCSSAAAAVYAVRYRSLREAGRAPDALGVTLATFLVGVVLLWAAAFGLGQAEPLFHLGPDRRAALLGLGVISTLVATACYAVAAQRLAPVVSTTLRLLIPVFATGFAFLLLREAPSVWAAPGALLVLGGLWVMLRP